MEQIRCAIYVRKSNPENAAEKILTSLESQEMFVRDVVARHENWVVVKVYSDHAFTGENTNRPAFKELVCDIKARSIDKIVVYRLDRVMRSLEDFVIFRANLLRPYNVELISATEDLNMNTLDGEFMMNIKMVVAEHELKVTRTRIKDKFAAMRKIGLWATGGAPVGYKLVDKKLVINEVVAPIIRLMYMRFIETNSPTQVAHEMNLKVLNLPPEDAKKVGIFHMKRVYGRLKSPVYKGYVSDNETLYKGQHEAIVSEEIWEQAQQVISKPIRKEPKERAPLEYALRSKLRCKECNHAMVVNVTTKRHKQYAYCTCLNKRNGAVCKGLDMNINVDLVHRIVKKEIRQILQTPEILGNLWKSLSEELSMEDAYKRLQNIDKAWDYLPPGDQTKILQEFVKTVWLGNNGIVIEFTPNSFCKDAETCEVLALPGKFYNRGSKQQVFVHQEEPEERQEPELLKALVQAEVWIDEIRCGKYASYQEIADARNLPEEYVRRGSYLAFLAPKVKEAIINGQLSPKFILRDFNRKYPATNWDEQEAQYLNG